MTRAAPTPASTQLGDQFLEAQNPALQQRVQMAMATIAVDVGGEPADGPNAPARRSLAMQVARSPQMFVVPFTTLLASKGITGNSSDDELKNMIGNSWNTMAGSTG